jgi:type II secretion system protein N
MDKDRRVFFLKLAGYPLFFLACLVLFFQITLPAEQIKVLVQKELETMGYRLEVAKSGHGLLGGLVFKDVAVVPVGADPKTAKLKLDEVSLGLPLWRLLTGNKAIAFGLKGFDGSVSGVIGAKETRQDVDLSVDGVNLGKMGVLWEALGAKFVGRFSGSIDISFDTKDAKKGNGVVKLALSDLALTEGKFSGFDLPKVSFGKVSARIDIKDGKAEVKEFKGKGKDAEVKGEGTATLAPRMQTSSLQLKVKFKPSDDFVTKNQKIQPMLYTIQSSKDKEGFYGYQITGALDHPFFTMLRP